MNHRHEWVQESLAGVYDVDGNLLRTETTTRCRICGRLQDPARSKLGRNNRSRGNRHELDAARKYGGEKTGPLGGADDIRGDVWKTQVRSRQSLAPAMWRTAFAALEAQNDGRLPRLLLRFTRPGFPSDDYFVIRGRDFLEQFGRDEREDVA